jgi:hypothetical protein
MQGGTGAWWHVNGRAAWVASGWVGGAARLGGSVVQRRVFVSGGVGHVVTHLLACPQCGVVLRVAVDGCVRGLQVCWWAWEWRSMVLVAWQDLGALSLVGWGAR